MKAASARNKEQVCSVGNYVMTGKVLGKGHFARVEEASHRIIGKKVAIKIIDLTCIKEEYARRNLHREPRVMSRLRHPCIAALYETMMHGPRLYVVMEAACGGDLCAHVLARAPRGLPESRARTLAAQLVSAVCHMHAHGVVHRDLKMENIMLDGTKQFIKIVDFGLSNVWSGGAALRTPCGSLEYAAPELFVDGRRYGPEVDLWSIGVIVYGMVTGGLPFGGAGGGTGAGGSRPQLRAAIARGFTRKQRMALATHTPDCKNFVQHLLEPNVEHRMKMEEASRHRWLRRPGHTMRVHPMSPPQVKTNREMFKHISELTAQPVMDVVAQIKADPYGPTGGMYNIKTHHQQLQAVPGVDLLWSPDTQEVQRTPASPPEYYPVEYRAATSNKIQSSNGMANRSLYPTTRGTTPQNAVPQKIMYSNRSGVPANKAPQHGAAKAFPYRAETSKSQHRTQRIAFPPNSRTNETTAQAKTMGVNSAQLKTALRCDIKSTRYELQSARSQPSPRCLLNRPLSCFGAKPVNALDSGDCAIGGRVLPSIDEHSNVEARNLRCKSKAAPAPPAVSRYFEGMSSMNGCPNRMGDGKKPDYCWRGAVSPTAPARALYQNTTIKRASLGNIMSPHSSSNSHCKSERAMPHRSALNQLSRWDGSPGALRRRSPTSNSDCGGQYQ